MKRMFFVAGVGVLLLGLVSWVTFLKAQPPESVTPTPEHANKDGTSPKIEPLPDLPIMPHVPIAEPPPPSKAGVPKQNPQTPPVPIPPPTAASANSDGVGQTSFEKQDPLQMPKPSDVGPPPSAPAPVPLVSPSAAPPPTQVPLVAPTPTVAPAPAPLTPLPPPQSNATGSPQVVSNPELAPPPSPPATATTLPQNQPHSVSTPPAAQKEPVLTPFASPQPAPQTPSVQPSPQPAIPHKPADERSETPLVDMQTGRQEPAISLEWIGPAVGKVGQVADHHVVIRNISPAAVQQTLVRVRLPAGLTLCASEPKPVVDAGLLLWDLGTLTSRQEKSLNLKLQADTKGDLTPQAWVTFTGSTSFRVRVREPKLLIKCANPERVLVGDAAAFTLTVSNPGDGSADQVRIRAHLSEGLEHARGNKIDFEIGNLAPGESRNVTLLCATRQGGQQRCTLSAEAEGGLIAKENATVNVILPRLDLKLEGPGLRYLDRKALYTLKVHNPGDAPAMNVSVANVVPPGFKVLAASDGGRHDFQARTVSWFLGEIAPGATREVLLEAQAVVAGAHLFKASAIGARGLRAEAERQTRVEGLSALQVELVDIEDPVEVAGETGYEVRISNTGSKTENNIRLVATIPEKMQFKNATGPVRFQQEGKTIVFESLEKLAPRADAIFRIHTKALQPGTVLFKIQVTSANVQEPVIKMEATRVYTDAPEGATGTAPSGSPSTASAPTLSPLPQVPQISPQPPHQP